MVTLLVLGPVVLPEVQHRPAPEFDLGSALMSLVAVLMIVGGVKEGVAAGAEGKGVLLVLGGVAVGAAFLSRQRHLREPLRSLVRHSMTTVLF